MERNVNGQKGELNSRRPAEKQQQPEEGAAPKNLHVPGQRPSVRPNAMKNREKQLIALKQMEQRIQRLKVNFKNKKYA